MQWSRCQCKWQWMPTSLQRHRGGRITMYTYNETWNGEFDWSSLGLTGICVCHPSHHLATIRPSDLNPAKTRSIWADMISLWIFHQRVSLFFCAQSQSQIFGLFIAMHPADFCPSLKSPNPQCIQYFHILYPTLFIPYFHSSAVALCPSQNGGLGLPWSGMKGWAGIWEWGRREGGCRKLRV